MLLKLTFVFCMSIKFSAFQGLPSPNSNMGVKSNHQKYKLTSRNSLLKLMFSQSTEGAVGLTNCLVAISDSTSDHLLTGTTTAPQIQEE